VSDSPSAQEYLETAEQAVEAAVHKGMRAATIPMSIAVMAVVAAVFGSLETTAASTAVLARSDAAVKQGQASDLWGYYQAKSIKKNMYEIAADQASDHAVLTTKAEKLAGEQADLQAQAVAREKEVAVQVAVSDAAMERHHRLTVATSMVHLAIALASISLVVGRRWLWFGALGCVAVGIVIGVI